MLSSSRHAQQAGLRCGRVTDNEETLQRRHAVTHHNHTAGKADAVSAKQKLEGIYLCNESTGKDEPKNKYESPVRLQVCSMFCTLNTFAKEHMTTAIVLST